nr:MAG TPA: YopX protein [Caudoviricetes sp.]
MREILFKAKRIDNGEWVEGCYISSCEGTFIQTNCIEHYYVPAVSCKKVDPETLCQFTGLCDKNGNKIWENDIIKFEDEIWMSSHTSCGTEYDSAKIENYGLIGYDENSARYDFVKYKFNENSVEADLHENHDIEFSEFAKENERIGNIFDNPELLQEEKHE